MAENDVKKRVQDAMKELGISAYAIAKTCSMNERTIYQQTNGSSKLSVEAIQALLRYKPELSASWILLGTGSMLLTEPQHETHTGHIRDDSETEELRERLRRAEREIDGLYERIKELKGDIATPHRSAETA